MHDPIDDDNERRQRRRAFIDRFTVAEQRRRRWIGVLEFAEYAARCRPCAVAAVYRDLAALLKGGELGVGDRSRVLLLDPELPIPGVRHQHRLSSSLIDGAIAAAASPLVDSESGNLVAHAPPGPSPVTEYREADFAPGSIAVEYLERSWLRRDDARRLLERGGFPWPPHFEREAQPQPWPSPQGGPSAATAQGEPSPTRTNSEAQMERASGAKKRGRPEGTGRYPNDKERVIEGLRMFRAGEVTSYSKAAEAVAGDRNKLDWDTTVNRLRQKIGAADRAKRE